MSVPEPKSIEGAQILIWILSVTLGLVSAAALWFLKRYFDSADQETESVKKKLISHESRMEKIADSIGKHADDIKREMISFKSGSLDFQRQANQNISDLRNSSLESLKRTNTELSDLEKHTTHIEVIMDKTREKAEDFDKKLDRHITGMKELTEHVSTHAKVIRGFIDHFKTQKTKMEHLEKNYETVRKDIGDLIIIKNKKPDEKP